MPKDNPFSDNPFNKSDGEKVPAVAGYDPYSTGASAWGSNGHTESTSSAWGAAGNKSYDTSPPVISVDRGDEGNYAHRAEQLDLKEKELRAKEAELRKMEEGLRATGALRPEKNWPKCCPFVHHDIPGEIPAAEQGMVRCCYFAFLGFIVTVFYNLFGSLVALCAMGQASGRLPAFFLAAVYVSAGIPGAWILWYMRVYHAAIKDRAFTYAIFFVFFCVHIIFCVWSAISPPLPFSNDWSHTGFICGIKAFGSNTFTGIVYVVGAALWTLETLWSIWCLKMVYSAFRGNGGDRRLKQEVAGAVATQAARGAVSR
ncbi:Putative secretory carrier-associated membrane protein 1 [Coccomyxa sp. Obi]|nr:Putative secretory carrier-associated membrane protein 1 [Coccomyxa sp. Obi]